MKAAYVQSMKYQSLMTRNEYNILIENGSLINSEKDHVPVIKLNIPLIGSTWLLTEIMPSKTNIAFGLCDIGFGSPEIGYVNLDDFIDILESTGLPTLRDNAFQATYPLSTYKNAAKFYEQVVTDEELIKPFVLRPI